MALFELASARLSARPQAPNFPSSGCSWPNLLLEATGKLCVRRRLDCCWILLLAQGPGLGSPAPQCWVGGHPLGLLLPLEKHWLRAQPACWYLSSELSSPGGLSLSCCTKMEPQPVILVLLSCGAHSFWVLCSTLRLQEVLWPSPVRCCLWV